MSLRTWKKKKNNMKITSLLEQIKTKKLLLTKWRGANNLLTYLFISIFSFLLISHEQAKQIFNYFLVDKPKFNYTNKARKNSGILIIKMLTLGASGVHVAWEEVRILKWESKWVRVSNAFLYLEDLVVAFSLAHNSSCHWPLPFVGVGKRSVATPSFTSFFFLFLFLLFRSSCTFSQHSSALSVNSPMFIIVFCLR